MQLLAIGWFMCNALLAQKKELWRDSPLLVLTLCYFQEGEKIREEHKATEEAQNAAEWKKNIATVLIVSNREDRESLCAAPFGTGTSISPFWFNTQGAL